MRRHWIRKLFRHLFRTAWWQPNKQSRKQIKEEADKLIGWDKETNPAWAKTWKYFIKRQHPWYGLIELNQFKIFEMRDYIKNHSFISVEEAEKQIKEMTEVLELGDKILADEYENYAHHWLKANQVHVTLIYEKVKGADIFHDRGKLVDKLYGGSLFSNLKLQLDIDYLADLTAEEKQKILDYCKDKKTYTFNEWLKLYGNGKLEDDFVCCYTGEWINDNSEEENSNYFTKLLNEAWQDRQNDINKYFECIAEGVDHWGD